MAQRIRILPSIPKILVGGLVLGVIPWVVSGYLFPRSNTSHPSMAPHASSTGASGNPVAETGKVAPRLLPPSEKAQRLPSPKKQPSALISLNISETKTVVKPESYVVMAEGVKSLPAVTEEKNAANPVSTSSLSTPSPSTVSEGSKTFSFEPAENAFEMDLGAWMPDRMPSIQKSVTESAPVAPLPSDPMLPENRPAEKELPIAENMPIAEDLSITENLPTAKNLPTVEKASPSILDEEIPEEPSEATVPDSKRLCISPEPEILSAIPPEAIPVRSEQLESIARQADLQIRHGFELAGRGAYYAARSEFIAALRLVAQGLDNEKQTNVHGKALAAGLTALKEAEDFLPRGSMLEAHLDIPALAASHLTPVLKNAELSQTTSLTALKSYLTYAQTQLALAAGQEYSGSMALRAMGKLHEELISNPNRAVQAAGPKAVVFYQAALLVSPQNYMAANDLGVLFARDGNLPDACRILEHSANVYPQATVLNNLAVVYQRLGRMDLAQQVGWQAQMAQQAEQAARTNIASKGTVQWVPSETFAQTSPNLASPPSPAEKKKTASSPTGIANQKPASPAPTTSLFGNNNPHLAPYYKNAKQKPNVLGQVPNQQTQR